MLDGIQRIQSRIGEIETQLQSAGQAPNPAAGFENYLNEAMNPTQNTPVALGPQTPMSPLGTPPPLVYPGTLNVVPFAQSNGVSCGQSSVAMSINALTGKNLRDYDIDSRYGFRLLEALNAECKDANISWKDGGNVGPDKWSLIEQKVNNEKTPVIVAMNGPEFSATGAGHIITITKVEGDVVTYADPADGTIKTSTKDRMNNAPLHPDGNFIFFAERGTTTPATPTMAMNSFPYGNPYPYGVMSMMPGMPMHMTPGMPYPTTGLPPYAMNPMMTSPYGAPVNPLLTGMNPLDLLNDDKEES